MVQNDFGRLQTALFSAQILCFLIVTHHFIFQSKKKSRTIFKMWTNYQLTYSFIFILIAPFLYMFSVLGMVQSQIRKIALEMILCTKDVRLLNPLTKWLTLSWIKTLNSVKCTQKSLPEGELNNEFFFSLLLLLVLHCTILSNSNFLPIATISSWNW